MHSIGIETDSLEIIQAILNPSEYQASGVVVTSYRRLMMSSFGRATINHCAREANVAAHELARFRFLERAEEVWLDHPPSFLIPSLVTNNDYHLIKSPCRSAVVGSDRLLKHIWVAGHGTTSSSRWIPLFRG